VEVGSQYEILNSRSLRHLVFPARDFWILLPDVEGIEENAWAPWQYRPSLGMGFVLLCKSDFADMLSDLRRQGLLTWKGDAFRPFGCERWLEYREVQILSPDWDVSAWRGHELFEQLRPTFTLSLSFNGGLRAPDLGGWLADCGPQVIAWSADARVQLRVENLPTDSLIYDDFIPTQEPFTPYWGMSGLHRVEVRSGNQSRQRLIQIVAWKDLEFKRIAEPISLDIGGRTVCGAWIGSATASDAS
jgi:hypothetical protein